MTILIICLVILNVLLSLFISTPGCKKPFRNKHKKWFISLILILSMSIIIFSNDTELKFYGAGVPLAMTFMFIGINDWEDDYWPHV